MTRKELTATLMERLQVSRRDAEVVLETVLEEVSKALVHGKRVEIRGFGSFDVRERRSRLARNPKTGDVVDVPPKRVPFFVAGNALRERVERG